MRNYSFGKGCRFFLNHPAIHLAPVAQWNQSRRLLPVRSGFESHREHEIHTNTSTSLFLRVDQWSGGRAVECDCPESSRGASPRRFESSPLREPRMNRPMRDLSRFGRCAPESQTPAWDGGPCGKGAVLLRLLGRKPPASSTLAPSASRSAVIGHGIGPGIQSAKNGLDRHGGTRSGIRVRCVRAHSSLV